MTNIYSIYGSITSHHSFHPCPKIHRQRSTRLDQASELHLLRGELHLTETTLRKPRCFGDRTSLQFLPPKQRKKCWCETPLQNMSSRFSPLDHHCTIMGIHLLLNESYRRRNYNSIYHLFHHYAITIPSSTKVYTIIYIYTYIISYHIISYYTILHYITLY